MPRNGTERVRSKAQVSTKTYPSALVGIHLSPCCPILCLKVKSGALDFVVYMSCRGMFSYLIGSKPLCSFGHSGQVD